MSSSSFKMNRLLRRETILGAREVLRETIVTCGAGRVATYPSTGSVGGGMESTPAARITQPSVSIELLPWPRLCTAKKHVPSGSSIPSLCKQPVDG